MKIKRDVNRAPGIPISSMSDIAFLLLIFIMVISLINYRREIKISYPEAANYEVTQDKQNLEIWVDDKGVIFYKGEVIQINALEKVIVDSIIEKPGIRIHIIADTKTKYKNIDDIMNILRLLQHRVVSLVVKD